jgi:hypothetical protein
MNVAATSLLTAFQMWRTHSCMPRRHSCRRKSSFLGTPGAKTCVFVPSTGGASFSLQRRLQPPSGFHSRNLLTKQVGHR